MRQEKRSKLQGGKKTHPFQRRLGIVTLPPLICSLPDTSGGWEKGTSWYHITVLGEDVRPPVFFPSPLLCSGGGQDPPLPR